MWIAAKATIISSRSRSFTGAVVARRSSERLRFLARVGAKLLRSLKPRPPHELTAAIRTNALHRVRARRAEGALVGADEGVAAGREGGGATLAGWFHFEW